MAIPSRHTNPARISPILRTFFMTSSIAGRLHLLQSEKSARLFIEVLYQYHSQRDSKHFDRVMGYVAQNSVKRRLAKEPEGFPYSSSYPGFKLDEPPQGLKPSRISLRTGTSEDVP